MPKQQSDTASSTLKNDTQLTQGSGMHEYTNTRLGFTMLVPDDASIKDDGVNSYVQIMNHSPSSAWRIYIATVSSSTLPKFIDTHYPGNVDGKGPLITGVCAITGMLATASETYDITFSGSGNLDPAEGDQHCSPDVGWWVKYSPRFNKAATWGGGQSFAFPDPKDATGYTKGYDDAMAKSFRFIPSN
jgi:hypothetical protein